MSNDHSRSRGARVATILTRAGTLVGMLMPILARGQTDFANTDAGRPLRTQDAIVLERFAFEGHFPNVRLLRGDHAPFALAFEPELAIGIESRTQLDLGVLATSRRRVVSGTPSFSAVAPDDGYEGRQLRVDEVHVRVLHQLNVETLGVPAIAIGAGVEVPLGTDDRSPVWSAVLVATRTWQGTRAHLNARLTSESASSVDGEPGSPWELAVALDRTLPLRHLLIAAELGATRQEGDVRSVGWYSGAGFRWQWTMRSSLDAGIERRFNDHAWMLSLGISTSFGIRSFTRGHG